MLITGVTAPIYPTTCEIALSFEAVQVVYWGSELQMNWSKGWWTAEIHVKTSPGACVSYGKSAGPT